MSKRCPEDSEKWSQSFEQCVTSFVDDNPPQTVWRCGSEIRLCREEWSCSLETNKPLACPILKEVRRARAREAKPHLLVDVDQESIRRGRLRSN